MIPDDEFNLGSIAGGDWWQRQQRQDILDNWMPPLA